MEVKDPIQTGILAVIALVLIVDVFIMDDGPKRREPRGAAVATQPISNVAAAPTAQPNQQNPDVSAATTINPAVDNGPKTSMSFAQMAHDFGAIKQNTENEHIFEFTNTGADPLIIQNAQGSCGCTVPEYPREPIAPGETGEIKVVYKPGMQEGNQNKSVTITANTEPNTTQLNISAVVEAETAGSEG